MTFNKTALALVVLAGVCGHAAAQTSDQIDAQIREFEKGAAESAIKYKDERIPPSPCDITVEQFMRTSQRMTIGQVESVLGCYNITTAAWQGSIGAHGNVQIDMNNMAINKPQSGLR